MRWIVMLGVWLAATGLAGAEGRAPAMRATGYSGIAPLVRSDGVEEYLVVHDRKDMPAHADRAWLGTLTLRAGTPQPAWRPLAITPPAGERPPNDLEACCAIPGLPNHFLLAESGYYLPRGETAPRYGRIIHVALAPRTTEPPGWDVRWEGSFRPLPPPADLRSKASQIEAMACIALGGGRLALVLTRMGDVGIPGRVLWGALDLLSPQPFALRGEAALAADAGPLGARSSAAIHLEPAAAGAYHLWSVATEDPGDAGPFRSRVFHAGDLRRVRGTALFAWCRARRRVVRWSLDGLKVEGLAPAPASLAGAALVAVTDDEIYGGLFRPLPARR